MEKSSWLSQRQLPCSSRKVVKDETSSLDPICHTLVGASLGATGLENRTRYGCTTLIIAANIPDIDFVFYFWGDARSYAFRRGITHGIPALIILPLLLALAMMILSRINANSRAGPEASFRWLLVLSAIGVATHPDASHTLC